ncbi:MAG: carboxylating nicotinate-nucleotide diphosphorylase [Nitriliruptor sp.]|nr:MAG: carboxylating nicotinate-nucleotide diphosphorylase [Nitriliruptor sp.]
MSTVSTPLPAHLVDELVRRTLAEDLGLAGDLSTDAAVGPEARGTAEIIARQAGTIAGLAVALAVFPAVEDDVTATAAAADGDRVDAGTVLARVQGPTRTLLSGERAALNLLGHASGIATATRAVVDAVAGSGARIIDTRKTTPGLRALEKYAVRCGGGHNHRFGLFDAVMLKDNHLIAAGGIAPAVAAVRAQVGHTVHVEVEVDHLEQVAAALEAGADSILLDNLGDDELRTAVALVAGRATTEASGGITPERAVAVAATGVDVISLGWLTHSAPRLDVALELLP